MRFAEGREERHTERFVNFLIKGTLFLEKGRSFNNL